MSGSFAERARFAVVELVSLLDDASSAPIELPVGWDARVTSFVAELLAANERLNLTRVVEPAAIARDHLLDALVALPRIDASGAGTVVDLGSGGGMPAIPLALARPDLRWTLVESVQKKAAFLRDVAAELELPNVAVIPMRAEEFGRAPDDRERHDLAIARACAPLPVLAELALPLVRIGGTLLAWKGPLPDGAPELEQGRRAIAVLGGEPPIVEPAGHAALGERTFVTVAKRGATPASYPRRPGTPGRAPLG